MDPKSEPSRWTGLVLISDLFCSAFTLQLGVPLGLDMGLFVAFVLLRFVSCESVVGMIFPILFSSYCTG